MTSVGKFHGKYLRYAVNPTLDVFRMCRRVLVKLKFYGSEFFGGRSRKQKIPLNYALNYAPGVTSDVKFYGKYLLYSANATLDVFRMCRRVLVKLMFYGSELSWRKVEKIKRFP